MQGKKTDIKLTEHARRKILERNIIIEQIKEVISNHEKSEMDKFDSSLVHLIKKMDNKFLRVIGKWESGNTFIVISAFYDRRLKRRKNK